MPVFTVTVFFSWDVVDDLLFCGSAFSNVGFNGFTMVLGGAHSKCLSPYGKSYLEPCSRLKITCLITFKIVQ
jgi:hypothetical protein